MTLSISSPEASEPEASDLEPSSEDPVTVDIKPSRRMPAPIRWLYDLIKGRVELYTLSYDEDLGQEGAYVLSRESVSRKRIPMEAVHVTGRGSSAWFLDTVRGSQMPAPGHATAIDLYCWFKNNSLDNSLNIKGKLGLDKKLLTYIGIGVIAVAVCAWYYLS